MCILLGVVRQLAGQRGVLVGRVERGGGEDEHVREGRRWDAVRVADGVVGGAHHTVSTSRVVALRQTSRSREKIGVADAPTAKIRSLFSSLQQILKNLPVDSVETVLNDFCNDSVEKRKAGWFCIDGLHRVVWRENDK